MKSGIRKLTKGSDYAIIKKTGGIRTTHPMDGRTESMRMAVPGRNRIGWLGPVLARLGPAMAALLVLSSCATTGTTPVPPGSPAAPAVRSSLFRSKDYVVVRLEGGETAPLLAERFLGDAARSWVIEDANEEGPFTRGQMIVIPLRDENVAGLTVDGYQTVPILCYHQFDAACQSAMCMPDSVFEQQMRYLKEHGYRVITFGQMLEFVNYRKAIPKKSAIITVDDGYLSVYSRAFPILKKYGFTATLFVYTEFINAARIALTWDQLREMKAAGFEIGSHSVSHADLTKKREGETDGAYLARVRKELILSKEIIDKKLGQDTRILAFPYGNYNQHVLRLTKDAGYELAVSVNRGGNPFFSDPLTLNRDQILMKDTKAFESRLNTFYRLPLR